LEEWKSKVDDDKKTDEDDAKGLIRKREIQKIGFEG